MSWATQNDMFNQYQFTVYSKDFCELFMKNKMAYDWLLMNANVSEGRINQNRWLT